MSLASPLIQADEHVHPADPADWTWSESWFFSWIDHDTDSAGFFRVGVLPNQRRAMLWTFVYTDGQWLGVEESRLAFNDVDLTNGVMYDKWAVGFAWEPNPLLGGARFSFDGDALVRSGPNAGTYVNLSIELSCSAMGACVRTGTGTDDRQSPYQASRFEQSLEAAGSVVAGGQRVQILAGAHRDRSWGPREWRQCFTLGDLQARGRQLYFVGRTIPGLGMGIFRDGDEVRNLLLVDGSIDFDDAARTIGSAWLRLEGEGSPPIEVTMRPIAPSIQFNMAHTCEVPERWLYWRTLIEANVLGWDEPCRGWFETSRYGAL